MVGIWLFFYGEIIMLQDLAYISILIEKSKKQNMKIFAANLNTLSGRTTTRVFDVLNIQMSSWIKDLKNLVPKELGTLWDRIGYTSFTTMCVTENYRSFDHIDNKDGGSGFILLGP